MKTFYVAATDRMTWGRGSIPWEALGHALHFAGRKANTAGLFEIMCPEGTVESDIYVNEMGSIIAPKGSIVKNLGVIPLQHIAEKFYLFFDELDKELGDEN